MPCRPKLCQRLAARLSNPTPTVPGNGHIWITDDLLSDAFNRYARVSHTSRRYGSNVPGPLEARRRLAKRRMGCAVAGASMGPPGGDFGALFGTGGGNFLENNWSYKPPDIRPDPPPETRRPPDFWSRSAEPSESLAEWDQELEIPSTKEELIEASRSALDDLLEAAEDREIVGGTQITPFIDFLTSSADEPGANNTARLTEWLAKRPAHSTAMRAITDLILGKMKLATINNDELMKVMRNLSEIKLYKESPEALQPDELNGHFHGALESILDLLHEQNCNDDALYESLVGAFANTTRDDTECLGLIRFMKKASGIFQSTQSLSKGLCRTLEAVQAHGGWENKDLVWCFASILDDISPTKISEVLKICTELMITSSLAENRNSKHILLWMRCLESSEICASSSGGLIHVVYTMLGEHFRPSEFSEHFGGMRTIEISRILLRSWFVRMDPKLLQNASDGEHEKLTHKGRIMLKADSRDLTSADLPGVSQIFEQLMAEVRPTPAAYTTLARAFALAGLRSGGVIAEIFALCQKLYSPARIHDYFSIMLHCPDVGIPKTVVLSLIEHMLAVGRPFRAICMFQDAPFVSFSEVPDLAPALLNAINFRTKFLYELLHREPEYTPVADREVHTLNITQNHIDAIHTLAYEISKAQTLRTRVAFRFVHAYYRFLQDRGAPLDPLISRALVTAGILRPIKERVWIPEARFEFILGVVERVEGGDVRAKLQKLAFRMREVTHDAVLLKRRRLQEGAWMSDGNKMAEHIRFRSSRWAKRQPVRTADGKSFYVPGEQVDRSSCAASEGKDGVVDGGADDVVWVRPSFLQERS